MTVGQDIVKLEPGGSPPEGGKEQASQEPKAPAPKEQSTSSDPRPDEGKREEKPQAEAQKPAERSAQEPPPEKKGSSLPDQESKQEPKKEPKKEASQASPPTEDVQRSEPKASDSKADSGPYGNRGERRVSGTRCWETILF